MRTLIKQGLSIALLSTSLIAGAGISTGSKTGTYIKIGQDISNTCSHAVPLEVFESKGSLDNYNKIVKDPNVKFIIAQYDVLQYMNTIGQKDAKKIKMVYPLYNEEIHIITKASMNVTKLSDLNGKKVAIGAKGSGTWVTTSLLIEKADLKWEPVYLGTKDALKTIVKGEIDALVTVAGVPTKLLSSMPENANEIIKIASLDDPILDELYAKSTIKEKSYPFQTNAVNTYSIKSILATYDYRPGQPSYVRVQKLFKCINTNLEKLQNGEGHPKWKEVNFENYKDVKWELHRAVKATLSDKPKEINNNGSAKSSILNALGGM